MVRVSNTMIGILNCLSLVIAVGCIIASIWYHVHGGSKCERVLQTPLLVVGLFLFVVSFLGLMGSCCKVNFILWIYLFVMFLLIVGLFCFTIFAIVITNKGVGKAVSGRGYKEYRLGDYSNWLQKYVVNGKNWDEIRSCLVEGQVCRGDANQTSEEYYKKKLSPIESGCCKPPTYCDFEYKNATFWTAPKSGPAVPDSDCSTWNNNQAILCFDCKSCKGGVLANIKQGWRHFAIFNICVLVILIIVYSTGCCAMRNNQSDRKYSGYMGNP